MTNLTYKLIIETYIVGGIGLIVTMFFIFKIYKRIIKKEKILNKKNMQEMAIPFYNKNNKIIDLLLMCLMLFWIILTIHVVKGCILDFDNVIKNNYIVTECQISSNTSEEEIKNRTVSCKNNNKEMNFTYLGYKLPVGTVVNVSYYEHLEIGQINKSMKE